jgi:CrcB protein
MVKEILTVFIGGGIGSAIRFLLSRAFNPLYKYLPLGTLSANILASIVFGVFSGWLLSRTSDEDIMRLFVLTGFCGGLSTFSTFNFEVYEYLKTGYFFIAAVYIIASITFCLLGFACATFIFSK